MNVVEIWKREDGHELAHIEGRGWCVMKHDGQQKDLPYLPHSELLIKFDEHFAAKSKYFDYEISGLVDHKADELYAKNVAKAECKCHSLWEEVKLHTRHKQPHGPCDHCYKEAWYGKQEIPLIKPKSYPFKMELKYLEEKNIEVRHPI